MLDQPVFKTGMFAVVLAYGLCWMVNTFIGDQASYISDTMGAIANQYPWVYIIAVFIVAAITTSQASTTMIMVPIGMALNLPVYIIIAGWVACNANYVIPASGQCVAAIGFDSAGTTKIGKYVLNHSYIVARSGHVCGDDRGCPRFGHARILTRSPYSAYTSFSGKQLRPVPLSRTLMWTGGRA
ncbi:MAG: anaerobic C4-dicarboxylate transporter family protein [Faecalibacterium prausnitzii]